MHCSQGHVFVLAQNWVELNAQCGRGGCSYEDFVSLIFGLQFWFTLNAFTINTETGNINIKRILTHQAPACPSVTKKNKVML